MEKDKAYKQMKKLRAENKTFDKFVSRVESKVERFFAKEQGKKEVPIEIGKVKKIKMTLTEKKLLNAYLSHKYANYLEGDEIYLKQHRFFFSIRTFRTYFI